jgi:hypothetical protein
MFWAELGDEHAYNGHLDSARRYLELALDMRRLAAAKVVDDDESNYDWQRELSASYDRLACLPHSTRPPEYAAWGHQVFDHAAKALGQGPIPVFHGKDCSCLRQVGHVSDEHGRSLPKAHVEIADESTSTDQNGQFEIHFSPDLPKGSCSVVIWASGYERWRGQPLPGGAPLQVRLSRSSATLYPMGETHIEGHSALW